MTVSQPLPGQGIRRGGEGLLRLVSGLFLAFVAIALAVLPWTVPFAVVTVLVMLFAAREWHRMVRAPAQRQVADLQPIHVQTIVTGVAVAAAVAALAVDMLPVAFALLAAGAIAAWRSDVFDAPLAAGVRGAGRCRSQSS